jgi:hypothetical protein
VRGRSAQRRRIVSRETIRTAKNPAVVAGVAGEVWASVFDAGEIWRIRPS